MPNAIVTGGGRGLTAFQLKVVALVCMTLDHIAAFGFEIPGVARFEDPIRTIGRIAAPCFSSSWCRVSATPGASPGWCCGSAWQGCVWASLTRA